MGPAPGFHTWNYRIVESTNGELSIHEVYYDDMGVPTDWTAEGVAPYGETMAELNTCFNMMQDAFYEPILKWVETEEAPVLVEHPYHSRRIEVDNEDNQG